MGFVRERVSFEDWNLYNSFKLVSKADSAGKMQVADKYSVWILDREREIYFISTGVIGRENIEYDTMILQDNKVNIRSTFERRFEGTVMTKGYDVGVIADVCLRNYQEKIKEIIIEILQWRWENEIDFIEMSELKYKEDIR